MLHFCVLQYINILVYILQFCLNILFISIYDVHANVLSEHATNLI